MSRSLLGAALLVVGATGLIGPTPPRDRVVTGAGEMPAPVPISTSSEIDRNVAEAYGKLPLSFVPNRGQADGRVSYSAHVAGASFHFTRSEAVFALRNGRPGATGGTVLHLAFLGANAETAIEGQDLQSGKVNYLVGGDPTQWRTDLPTYGQVIYRELWPGVDMAFSGDASRLKYEFVVAPGTNVDDIRLAYRGANALSIDHAGNLVIAMSEDRLTDTRPISYQEIAGHRVPIDSRFVLLESGSEATAYGFAVGDYDAAQPLVIDPGLVYSTYLGGNSSDVGNPIAIDSAGNAYVTGETSSNDFPITLGAFDGSRDGVDVFVTKVNPAGTGLVYSTFLGGNSTDRGFGIAIDATGNAYVTGETFSTNFPTAPLLIALDSSYNGNGDAFVTKLNAAGTGLIYSTYLGANNTDRGHEIAVDAGSAYVTGETQSNVFPTTTGSFDTTFNGGTDAFVAKLNVAGTALSYSTYLGGSQLDRADGIAVDGAGSAYVTGRAGPGFPTTAGAFDTSHNGNEDVFVTKLNPTGTAPLVYSTFLGGSSVDRGFGIAIDATGNAYVTGDTTSSLFPTAGSALDTTRDGQDAFVTKVNPTGAGLVYSTFLGGSSSETGFGIAVDVTGNAYVTGETNSTGFPTTPGAFDTSHNGNTDVFVSKLNPSGSALLYSTYLGASNADSGHGIKVDSAGNAYVTGETNSTGFPTTPGAFDTTFGTSGDAFVTKLDMIPTGGAATLSINNVAQNEGNAGTTAFSFTVTRSGSLTGASTVDYDTADGTATGGTACTGTTDYMSQSGTVAFAPLQTSQQITILVCGDTTLEPSETFFVNLSNPTGATITDGQGLGTITNDDAAPTLSIDNASQNEGNALTTPFTFTVTKSGSTASSATVNFDTADGTATGGIACVGATDYISQSGTLVFAPTQMTATITVMVCGDTTFEPNETFFVNLSNPSGATIADDQGLGTIVNDDAPPTLSIDDVTLNEGDVGTTPFSFTVTKNGSTAGTTTVNFATADGTATGGTTCTGGADYISQSGTLTFTPLQTSMEIIILVCGDTTFEPNQTFFVNLSNAAGATITDGQGLGTIVNDDAPPTLSINDVTQDEGNTLTTPFTFTVTKSGSTASAAMVDFDTADGTATGGAACVGDIDYITQSGTLVFTPLETSMNIVIMVCGDTTFEPSETFFVNLSDPDGATITDGQGLGTISNDDAPPTLSIDDVTQNEGHLGTTPFTFTVTKTGATASVAMVDFATVNGTATGGAACPGADYMSQSGTLTFAPLQTSQTIIILVCGDLILEPDETFFVNLSNPDGATIADGQGLGTIVNDEVPAFVTMDPPFATNTVGTQHCVTATVTDASLNPIQGVTVRFSVTGANPTTGSDATDANGDAEFCYTGTIAGPDTITAFADTNGNGTRDTGEPSGAATKTWLPGPPATLILTPSTAINTVGEDHEVTATVRDSFGNPTPGVVVRFTVTSTTFPDPSSGSDVTDASGEATFTYSASLPGEDAITAFADSNNTGTQNPGEPTGAATKTWIVPGNTALCEVKITEGGWIIAINGDRANFGGNARVSGDGTVVDGQQNYQDHGPADERHVKSTKLLATTCSDDLKSATIFGKATIDDSPTEYIFRIDVTDEDEPGTYDTYGIMISDGYLSGQQKLQGGNVQIHKN